MTIALVLALALAAPPSPPGSAPGDEVRAADVAMARAVAARNPGAFAEFLDEAAIFASASGLSRGRDDVVDSWRPYFTTGGPTLAWRPGRVLVASSGDLAVTTGRFTWSGTSRGKPARAEGKYVTVWRRGDDRRWRVIFDAPLELAAALGSGLGREPVRSVSSGAGDLEATLGTWRRGVDEGAHLTIRRGHGRSRRTVIDSAFAFRRSR